MSVLVNIENDAYSFGSNRTICSKGAPEKILKSCKYVIINGNKKVLTDKEIKVISQKILEMTSSSYRAMAIAYKDLKNERKDSSKNITSSTENGLTLLGIVFMEDPPRPEVKDAIKICQDAGITVKMITGDSGDTAKAIASRIGLSNKSISGDEMDVMTDDELSKVVKEIVIFYRVKPEHKLRIVRALKVNGEIVTMTGDGVNDAPALKEAHIGVAMGKNGTDVSRESSDLILKDDHFATIVDAVREGRTIFNNIQKFTVYQVSINIAQVMLILVSLALGLPLPLIAMQILFMNIFSDELTAITLAFNTYSKDVMNQPPRRKAESEIITKPLLIFMLLAGLIMTIGAIGIFYYMVKILGEPLDVARSTVFITMTLFAIVNAYNFRSFRKQVLTRSVFVNKYLFYASGIALLTTILIMHTKLGRVFELVPIGFHSWVLAVLLAVFVVLLFDTVKFFNNKYHFIDKI
jgi:P-type Ca2+ transporter type 2C